MELLAPAGNREKLELAVAYGADAVYLGGNDFSLRNQSGNFTRKGLDEAIAYAHVHGVKVYVTCNIYPRNHEIEGLADFIADLGQMGPNALIIADAGVLELAREYAPHIPVHLSTQANTTSYASVNYWRKQGVTRVNIARELSLTEIAEIHQKAPAMELEGFVHGAMCISHSGRCLMSSFMANRDSNRGLCAHPCRWQYYLVEELRPGQFHPVTEDERGTYFFNSRDLCMLPYLDKMAQSGLCSIKIEGRMKTLHYLGTVLRVYRNALDTYLADPVNYMVKQGWLDELEIVNTRGYTTGFYLGYDDAAALAPDLAGVKLQSNWQFAAVAYAGGHAGSLKVEVRNQMRTGDALRIISPHSPEVVTCGLAGMVNEEGLALEVANPGQKVTLNLTGTDMELPALSLIRRKLAK